MEQTIEQKIAEILKEKRSGLERLNDLEKIVIKGSCERKYYEEEEAWPACYPFTRKRGIVEYYNCDDASENRIYYGEWHCTG